jgi:ABC-type branched-subunit amino acid transport system substrate-binding protein
MRLRLRATVVLALAAAAAVPAAASSDLIGVPLPLSGPRKPRGEMILHALQIKADEINAAGGVDGRSIELLPLDNASTDDGARKVAAELAGNPRVLAVIGHYDSEPVVAALPVYDRARVPVFLPSVGTHAVLGHSPWVFSGTYSDVSEARTMAVFIQAIRHHKNLLVFHNSDKYGKDLWDAFQEKAARLGLKTRDIEYPAAGVPDDYLAKAVPTVPSDVDAIVVFGHSDTGGAVIRQLRERGVHLHIYGSSRIASGELLKSLGSRTENLHAAYPFLYDTGSLRSVEFHRTFVSRYGSEPNPFALFAYDGLGLIAEAIRVKGRDRKAIRDYLAALDSPLKTYDGASGPMHFNKDGSTARDMSMTTAVGSDGFFPTFQQLREVTERHTLDHLAEKIKAGEVLVADKVPYFLIQVVYAGIEWYRVDQVNAKDLSFDAEFFLWLNWSGDVDISSVQFLNEVPGKGYRIEMGSATVPSAYAGGPAVKWVSYRYKGTFLHPYDLHQFPFDRQELPLLLAHKNLNANKIQLISDRSFISGNPVREIYPQEWRYLGRDDYGSTFRYASAFGNPTYLPGETQAPFSVYTSSLKIRRLLFPYLVTLFLPMAILIFVSLLSLLIPKEQFSTRNSLIMSSLLGMLVYHMAQARALPQVGYLMKADLYFVVSYVLLAILVLGINVVNLLFSRGETQRAAKLDARLHWVFIAGVVLAYGTLTVIGLRAGR